MLYSAQRVHLQSYQKFLVSPAPAKYHLDCYGPQPQMSLTPLMMSGVAGGVSLE